jgi:type I restriction enzyme S subunit
MENLNSEAILSFPCIVPPQNEQQAIVSLIEGIHGRANTIMSTIDRQISLLQEHRQALITAAVTGELDVTGKEH